MTKQRVQHPPLRDVNATRRVAHALDLRAQRMRYEDIATACGYGSAGAAHKAIMRELERTASNTTTEKARREELDSLDRLEYKCWQRLENPKYDSALLFAVDRILAIKERRARLMGLDVPVEVAPFLGLTIVQEIPQGYLGGPP